jgi:hypothetical protein
MTTLATLATKDALVMGCDSLGSVTKWMVDPFRLIDDFFDPNSFKLKTDQNGKPLLQEFHDIYSKSESLLSHDSCIKIVFTPSLGNGSDDNRHRFHWK